MGEKKDVVVIGGGPAGSAFAGIMRKYAPEVEVTVLEKARFPRYHIGESTIPVANAVFRDLGVYDKLYDGRFVRKFGVSFVWGQDRAPWNADYLEIRKLEPRSAERGANDVIDVVGQDFKELMRREERRDVPLTAINVRRAEFDQLLLEHAAEQGADVRQGTRVNRIHKDAAGAIAGLDWEDDTGRTGSIDTPFILDASGQSSMLTRGRRVNDPNMANFAVYGYLKGADWKVVYRGERIGTTVFIAAVEQGWIWYIPIGDDLMSCGAVTHTSHFKDRLKHVDVETFFWEMLRACPEIKELTKNAELRTDFLPDGQRVAVSKDWSSWADSPVGEGWAAAGDAAIFVDPILSSGVTLALMSGHRAAYTFNTIRKRPDLDPRSLWRAYADYIRGEAGSYLALARYFYGNNRAAESWWWQAQRLVNGRGRLDLQDRDAFTMATAGFFPMPRAISVEIMAPLLAGITGATPESLINVYHDEGVPPAEALVDYELTVRAPFRLALRTEPSFEQRPDASDPRSNEGLLDVFHDLVTDDFDFAHRLAAAPCRIAPAMAPVVEAMARHTQVASLLAEAPDLVPGAPAEAVRRSTLEVLRLAAIKGFLQLTPPPAQEVAS